MKNNQINDERVTNIKRQIVGEAYGLVMIFLLSSILIKQFILNAEFSQYAVEFIAFLVQVYILLLAIFLLEMICMVKIKKYYLL